jgi:hypothetical protein
MREYLGGCSTYYRYHHGERQLSPEQQEWIKQLFSQYGYEDIEFDCSEETLDFQ